MTTSDELIKFVKKVLKGKQLVVAIQSEPYVHVKTPKGIKLQKGAGGAHVLLDGVLKQVGGLMVAVGRGTGDQQMSDAKGRIRVPPDTKTYTLKRIFLKKKELDGFYYGFANQTLWPLCHAVFIKPIFHTSWWEEYKQVNQKFADAILEEIKDDNAFIWVNDYHFALLPKMLQEKHPKLSVGVFWHIPWPTHEIFRICPWRKEILEGLLGADFIGFHRGYHVDNFVECARRELGVIVDNEPKSIIWNDNHTKLANLPAGIDYHEIQDSFSKHKLIDKRIIKRDFGFNFEKLIIGVDRIDYTKGLVERLKILDRFFEKYPEYIGKVVYFSVGAPSRIHIPAYKNLNKEILDLVEKINWKYSTNDWFPIVFVDQILPREKIFEYYRLADVCLVTALDDGMNLVAKEFVLCSDPEKGVLVLSKFTGAAKDLKWALQINPYSVEASVDVLRQALEMNKKEKIERNKNLKNAVKANNIYDWAKNFIEKTEERV